MAIGNQVNGGTIHGAWKGLDNEESDVLGPAGLPIAFDYRSVLAEILAGAVGDRHTHAIFPAFVARPVGLINRGAVPIAQAGGAGCEA